MVTWVLSFSFKDLNFIWKDYQYSTYHLLFPLQLMFTVHSFHLYTYNLLYRSVQHFNLTTEASGTKQQAAINNVRVSRYTKTKQSWTTYDTGCNSNCCSNAHLRPFVFKIQTEPSPLVSKMQERKKDRLNCQQQKVCNLYNGGSKAQQLINTVLQINPQNCTLYWKLYTGNTLHLNVRSEALTWCYCRYKCFGMSHFYEVILKIYRNTKFWEATLSSVTPFQTTAQPPCTVLQYYSTQKIRRYKSGMVRSSMMLI